MSISNFTRRTALALGAVGITLSTALPGAAQDVSFEGETIEWLIPFSAGGGSDTWARFLAPFLTKHLPGNPSVQVVNEPGGGSTKGANLFAARAEPDGLTILGTSGSTQFPYLLGDPRVRYDYADWTVVMATPTGGVVYTTPNTGVESADQIGKLEGQDLIYASQGATSLDLVPLLGFRLMGLDVRHVFGFQGRGDGRLAFERGEVNIDYQTSSAYLQNVQPLVDEGIAIPLFSWGALDDDGNIVRDPTFPDMPSYVEAYEMVNGEPPSGEEFEAYKAFFVAGFPAQKMTFLPEGTDQSIIDAYKQAFVDIQADPEFQETKGATIGDYQLATGDAAQTLYEQGTRVRPEVRQSVVDLLTSEYDVTLD
ncbi:tripartite-type tricarboxylate transporter receptor subunit TctC [Palleronia aestuarii]|uniref:Tripartite-type tricarboxylate transporter receptor subunit TctC n=1 Tax=Palleronia aestuarii TaxID=568105 RepID=A0A2W7NMH3_9RHOB|nr:tripartite tricarboxylate transporter substrate-binding protein [Palleronia aestuarii]PZX14366.1 tripartite-type tricarboxylate transporter receptor subunit TctC [Palleronia aestuarii]